MNHRFKCKFCLKNQGECLLKTYICSWNSGFRTHAGAYTYIRTQTCEPIPHSVHLSSPIWFASNVLPGALSIVIPSLSWAPSYLRVLYTASAEKRNLCIDNFIRKAANTPQGHLPLSIRILTVPRCLDLEKRKWDVWNETRAQSNSLICWSL